MLNQNVNRHKKWKIKAFHVKLFLSLNTHSSHTSMQTTLTKIVVESSKNKFGWKRKHTKHKSGMCATWKFKSRLKIKCFHGSFKTAVALASYVHLSMSTFRRYDILHTQSTFSTLKVRRDKLGEKLKQALLKEWIFRKIFLRWTES